jgi:GPH family glycoside/pentoside/hexuronide:cation symporter
MSENPSRSSEPDRTSTEHHETRPEDRVPLGQKLAVGMGGFPNATANLAVQQMAFPIFNMVLGVSPWLVGLALTIPRLWDSVTDPVMGTVSDNFRSRFGRRRPFIVAGAFLIAITYVALWLVPSEWVGCSAETSQSLTFAWLLVGGLIFYTCYTIYSVPLVSLTYEMTPDYHERTRVMAFWGFFMAIGSLCVYFYGTGVFLSIDQMDANQLAGGEGVEEIMLSMRVGSLILALLVFVGLGVIPGIFGRERIYRSASQQEKVRLFSAVGQVIRSRPMLSLTGIVISLAIAGNMAGGLAWYIVGYHVFDGDLKNGGIANLINGALFQIVGVVAVPVMSWMAVRLGKKAAMMVILGLAAAGGVAKWFIYVPGGVIYTPEWLTYFRLPLHPFMLDPILSAPIWAALNMLVPAMMADMCDVDEYQYGKRREGIFGAVFTWIMKFGFSISFFISGVLVTVCGFNEALGTGQPEGTFVMMRLFFAGFSVLAMVLGMISLVFYNVSEKRAYEVRQILEQRRGRI